MRVLHVVLSVSRSFGGPARSVQGLVAALCKRGIDAWILPLDNASPWIRGVRKFNQTISNQTIKQFDLVHIHGIWDWRLHKVAVMCRKAGVRYVIAPRGMLEPWSLKQKALKKRIARWLYQDRDLRLAAALHATAESEAEQFRALGFRNPIIVSPNGVNVPEERFQGFKVSKFRGCEGGRGENERRALFVSRMHPKKGVLELVESWARIRQSNNQTIKQWSCELVYTVNGAEEKTYEQKVKDRILALGMSYKDKDGTIHPSPSSSPFAFIFTGPLDDTEKWNAYARADLFVLPTYSENFGIVVAEALRAGLPVITTKGTPWAELEERKCGWWVDLPGAGKEVKVIGEGEQWNALDDALREAMSLPAASSQNILSDDKYHCSPSPLAFTSLKEMGARGHQLVTERYTWSAVCDKIVRGYEEIRF